MYIYHESHYTMNIFTYISTHINIPFKYQVNQGHKAIGYPVTTDKITYV